MTTRTVELPVTGDVEIDLISACVQAIEQTGDAVMRARIAAYLDERYNPSGAPWALSPDYRTDAQP